MSKSIKKFKHGDYIVDSVFERNSKCRQTVKELTEKEAKDLCCNLINCIGELRNVQETPYLTIEKILYKYNINL